MRYSQLLIPTVKETPADAEVASHRLMIRAGYIRKVASGTYTYLLLGLRSLRKAMAIVREEMDAAGAQEILMPSLQPMELWERTGRRSDYGETMFDILDRHGRHNTLSPTAEEVCTTLVGAEVSSYRQLPLNLYQISPKFRDEFRPRFGVLRSREFIMKDAYSFDADEAGMDASYRKMYDAYCRICERCGLPYVAVEAESGPIGGSGSHEFMIPSDAGEDVIVHTEDLSYAANIEKAQIDPPPEDPALAGKRQAAPPAEEVHTPGVGSIEAVCELMGTRPEEMIKTLIYWTKVGDKEAKRVRAELARHDGRSWGDIAPESYPLRTYAVLVRGDHEISDGKLDRLAGEPIELASETEIRTVSGAAVGFAGPTGLGGKVARLVVDHSVAAMPAGVTGANKTDYHTRNVVPGRDFPLEGENVTVADIRLAVEGDTHDGKKLVFRRGIEMGHVFKLGTKYSESLGAKFLDESGVEKPFLMGCYGIGINRIVAAAVETGCDEAGIVMPVSIAPFEVEVLQLNNDNEKVVAEAQRIYTELRDAGVDVLLDDRDARGGVKFKDADLIGIPLRVVVGQRALAEGAVEIKRRTDAEAAKVPAGDAATSVVEILNELKARLKA